MTKESNLLRQYLKKCTPLFVISGIFIIVIHMTSLGKPIIIKAIIEFLQNKTSPAFLMRFFPELQNNIIIIILLILLLAAIVILICILIYLSAIYTNNRLARFERQVLNDLFNHIGKIDIQELNAETKNEIISIYARGYEILKPLIYTFLSLATNVVKIIISVVYLLHLSRDLFVFSILPLILIPITIYLLKNILKNKYQNIYQKFVSLVNISQVILNGFKEIKDYRKERYFGKLFKKKNKEYKTANIDYIKINSYMGNGIGYSMAFLKILVLIFGGYLLSKEHFTFGSLMAFYMQYDILQSAMLGFAGFIGGYSMNKGIWDKICDIFNAKEDICTASRNLSNELKYKIIQFKEVSVLKENKKILNNINITLSQKKSIGIIGNNGSGKTTLVNLLLRFLNPTKGSIFIDEVNMQDIPIQDVRTHICSASQNPYMFNMSIADNINMGRTNKCIDDEEFMHMKQLLDIDEFLHYPDDYYLLYGKERKLSGGQKQRLCLMRTLLAKPKILLIDEALSGFDAWHEEKVVKYILNEYKDVLKIIISNRITTLRNLDYILVLINGEIVEQGTHDDLIVQMGFYADFYNKQILRMDMQQYDNKK